MRSPTEIIREQLGAYLVEGVRYHSELPAELSPWYVYTSDGGHSIVAILAASWRESVDLAGLLVPVPVRSVLRGYEIRDGYVVVDLPYDRELGLVTPPEDDEYEGEGEGEPLPREVTAWSVGKPYNPRRSSWSEGAQYNYRDHTHELLLFYNRPGPAEIRDIARGRAEFALDVEHDGDVVVLCYRFGDVARWSDAPYSIRLVPEPNRTIPPTLSGDETVGLQVMLIDAADGIVRAIRLVALSPDFSEMLHDAIRLQASRPFTVATYNAALATVYGSYTTPQLVERAVARSRSTR